MIDKLIEKIIKTDNPSVIGLDTDINYLPQEKLSQINSLSDAAIAVCEFNMDIIDAVYDIVPAVKVQIAYYEQLGSWGLNAFERTLDYARSKKLLVIADAKRNDIGSTASAYSKAFLGQTDINQKSFKAFETDFLTVNAYLGSDGINPFVQDCQKHDKGIFVLVKTSNPSSSEFQNRLFDDGKPLFHHMGEFVAGIGKNLIGKYGYSDIGAVVGATHPQEAALLRKMLPNTFFLVPGYGAQGGSAESLKSCFDSKGLGAIVNSSRGIICAYKTEKYKGTDYAKSARMAALDMKRDLNRVRQN